MPHLSGREYRDLLGLGWDLEEAEAVLSPLDRAQALQHLLVCPRCRRLLSSVFLDLDLPSTEDPAAPLDTAAWVEEAGLDFPRASAEPDSPEGSPAISLKTVETILFKAIERIRSEEKQDRGDHPDAVRDVEALLSVPPELRLDTVESKARFRSPEVVDRLLSLAQASQDPFAVRQMASLAGAALGHQTETSRRHLRQALITCLMGDVERRFGRLDLAEDIFRDAALLLRNQPLMLKERVVLCRMLASLRQEQGRIDEALGLLEHASLVAEEVGAFDELAAVRLAYGWLLLDEEETERAVLPLQEALALASDGHNTYTSFSALHALALAFADLGEDERLEVVFRRLEELVDQIPDPLDVVRSRWVHAKAEARRNEPEKAIAELRKVLASLLALGPGHEAALAGIELGRLILETSEDDDIAAVEELRQIGREVLSLSTERLASHLRPALQFAFDFPVRRSGFYMDVLLSAEMYLERARFNPAYPYHPTPEPESLVTWRDDFSPALRRRAAKAAGVRLDQDGNPESPADLLLLAWSHEALTGVRIHFPSTLDDGTLH
jgi:tetratricopeptide (TPR) repeat protein